MNITFLKTGGFSIHPARGPVVKCLEGLSTDLNDEAANVLINAGWAEADEVEKVEAPAKSEDPIVPPWEQEDWNPEADDAKDMLEAYGLEAFDVDINKRKSVDNLIIELKELLEDSTGDN